MIANDWQVIIGTVFLPIFRQNQLSSKCHFISIPPGGIPIDRVFELSWLFIVKVGESVPIKISHLDF